jgi:serine/threonine-protein kinase RsbW
VTRAICRPEELQPLVEEVIGVMIGRAYSEGDRFRMWLAMQEAGTNALKHGNGYSQNLTVLVRYHVGDDEVFVEVEDEGPGFDPDDVANPLDPENVERPSGRGLFLMRRYMDEVRYEGRGNRVVLVKSRSLA